MQNVPTSSIAQVFKNTRTIIMLSVLSAFTALPASAAPVDTQSKSCTKVLRSHFGHPTKGYDVVKKVTISCTER